MVGTKGNGLRDKWTGNMMAMDMKFSRVPGDIACYQQQPQQQQHRHDTHNSENNSSKQTAPTKYSTIRQDKLPKSQDEYVPNP
jgi:hypothetical protein